MKKILANILTFSLLTIVVWGVFAPQVAQAAFFDIGMDVFTKVFTWIGRFILEISALLLTLSGILLNSAMNVTLNISSLVNETSAVDATWRVIRDFSSIFFIFVLLYASIATILGLPGMAPKSLIPKIIIAGLLINFSLFFTKLIIDASNTVALGFYSAIAPPDSKPLNLGAGLYADDGGISNVFMQQLGLVTLYNPSGLSKENVEKFSEKIVPVLFLGSAVMLFAAGTFFAVSLMLLVRMVVLLLLMALSPIYFIAMVLPQTAEYAARWRKALIGQSLFPAVYLALVYVALKITKTFNFLDRADPNDGKLPSFSEAFMGGGSVGIVFNYLVVIILLNAAFVFAVKSMGEAGAVSNKLISHAKKIGYSSISGAKWAGRGVARNTLGWAASAAASSEGLRDFAAANKYGVGRLVFKGVSAGAASYDKRVEAKAQNKAKFAETLGYNKAKILQKEENLQEKQGILSDANLNLAKKRSELETAKQKRDIDPSIIATLERDVKQAKAQYEDAEKATKDVKSDIKNVKLERKEAYKKSITDSLWTILSNSNKEAATKLTVELLKKDKEKEEEKLKEIKNDIKVLVQKQKAKDSELTEEEQNDLLELYEDQKKSELKIQGINVTIAQNEA